MPSPVLLFVLVSFIIYSFRVLIFSLNKMISKIQLIGNKEVTLFVKLNR